MIITHVEVYGYSLSYAHGQYVMSQGRASGGFDSTVVRLVTSDGFDGWGEVSSLAGNYLPAFTGGIRAALFGLCSHVLGWDPLDIDVLNRRMDEQMLGQYAAKSAIDMACWDILGKCAGLPVSTLLGGVAQNDFPLYAAVPLGAPGQMRDFVEERKAEGVKAFQIKVGNAPLDDVRRVESIISAASEDCTVIADANGGWDTTDALIAVRRLQGLPVFIEQPCRETDDCALVQRASTLPLVLDESVVTPADLYRAKSHAGATAVNIKLSRVGGISAARRMRDLAQALFMKATIEDMWGGDITTAAMSHLAASTKPSALLTTPFFNDWTNEHVAGYEPRSLNGRGSAPTGPGLGIEVRGSELGTPLFSV